MATPRRSNSRRSNKKSTVSVDFKGVESGGKVIPEDDYLLRVDEVELKNSDGSGEDYLSFVFEVDDGDFSGTKLYHNCSLQPQALFNLRSLLEALGFEVPDGPMDLEPADLIDLTCVGSVYHEKYQGKTKNKLSEFRSGEEEEESPSEKKPAKKPPRKGSKDTEEESEEKPSGPRRKSKAKEPEIVKGSKVSFTDDEGNELEGKVTAVEDDEVTVKVGRDEWVLEMEELSLVE